MSDFGVAFAFVHFHLTIKLHIILIQLFIVLSQAFNAENPLLQFENATAAALESECSSDTQMPKPYASPLSWTLELLSALTVQPVSPATSQIIRLMCFRGSAGMFSRHGSQSAASTLSSVEHKSAVSFKGRQEISSSSDNHHFRKFTLSITASW